MPFDSEGIFSRIHNWEDDRINDIDIASDRHDEEDDNFANGLSQCLLKSGVVSMQGNLNMGSFNIKNIADAKNNNDAVNLKQVNDNSAIIKTIINTIAKVGDIKASVHSSNHDNWLLCNGQAVSRTKYSDLYKLIGTNFGSGDGTTTFNLPDYRGKFLRGLGGNSANNIYTTQAEGLPNISGTLNKIATINNNVASGVFSQSEYSIQNFSSSGSTTRGWSNINFNAKSSNNIYGASTHVTPINQAVNFFIKAKLEE